MEQEAGNLKKNANKPGAVDNFKDIMNRNREKAKKRNKILISK